MKLLNFDYERIEEKEKKGQQQKKKKTVKLYKSCKIHWKFFTLITFEIPYTQFYHFLVKIPFELQGVYITFIYSIILFGKQTFQICTKKKSCFYLHHPSILQTVYYNREKKNFWMMKIVKIIIYKKITCGFTKKKKIFSSKK